MTMLTRRAVLARSIAAATTLATELTDAGATVDTPALPIVFKDYFADYLRLLSVMINQGMPPGARAEAAAKLREAGDLVSLAQADGLVMDAAGYIALANRRAAA